MPADKTKDITHLFYLAFDWYKAHPGEQIPLAIWEEKADDYGILADEWLIKVGNREIINIQTTIIPAVAAINLGLQSHEIMAIIQHHGMDSNEFLGCTYRKLLNEQKLCIPGTEKPFMLDAWNISREIVNAMCLDKELSEDLATEFPIYEDTYGTNFEFEIACLLSTNEKLWPVTHLEKFVTARQAGTLEPDAPLPRLTPLNAFIHTDVDFHELTYDQLLTILDRSGNLNPEAISENGFGEAFSSHFFKELFVGLQKHPSKGVSHLAEAMSSGKRPDLLEKINASIIRSLPDSDPNSLADAVRILAMMNDHLDKDLYAKVFESMTIKLNIAPLIAIPGLTKSNKLLPNLPALREFDEAGDKILKRLYDELADIEPSAFRKPQFSAIGSLVSDWKVPQDFSGIDLQELLIKTLCALDAYQGATHYDVAGDVTDSYAIFATKQTERLSQYVAQNVDADYQRLAGLPSNQKALLAINGFDVKKLPGLTRKEKGQVLSDGLGL